MAKAAQMSTPVEVYRPIAAFRRNPDTRKYARIKD